LRDEEEHGLAFSLHPSAEKEEHGGMGHVKALWNKWEGPGVSREGNRLCRKRPLHVLSDGRMVWDDCYGTTLNTTKKLHAKMRSIFTFLSMRCKNKWSFRPQGKGKENICPRLLDTNTEPIQL
jgi:hypothetical protein